MPENTASGFCVFVGGLDAERFRQEMSRYIKSKFYFKWSSGFAVTVAS